MQQEKRLENLEIVYRMLRKAAEMGDPSPSNSLLCVATGTGSSATATGYVQELHRQGRIVCKTLGRRGRIITIPETGERTAEPGDPMGHRARLAAMQRKRGERNRAKFADLVAEHGTITEAARQMGISQQRGSQLWKRVLEDMEK